MGYKINTGNLQEAYATSNGVMCLDKITTKRRVNLELREIELYAGNGVICYLDGRRPKLAITSFPINPVFNDIGTAFAQLSTTGLYHLHGDIVRIALDDGDTVSIDLSRILLNSRDEKHSALSAQTSANSHTFLGTEEKKLLRRLFGTAGNLKDNLQMLNTAGIDQVEIALPSLDYILRNVERGGAFAQVATISSFVEKSSVDLAYGEVEVCKFIVGESDSDDAQEPQTKFYGVAVVTGTPFDHTKHGAVGKEHFAKYTGELDGNTKHLPAARRSSEIESREIPLPIVPRKRIIGTIVSRKK